MEDKKLLEGIRVVDATIALAGPAASQRMADMGADIIKVESPTGDFSRNYTISNAWVNHISIGFLALNRNKRSIVVNLKTPGSSEVIARLVSTADIFLQNFRPGVAKRLGLDYEHLSQYNPGLVYVQISGYGQTGKYADLPGQDLLLQAMSGVMWNVGRLNDPPIPSSVYATDVIASHLAVEGALTAYIHRLRTGQGQLVDVNMLGGLLDAQCQELSAYFNAGVVPTRGKEMHGHTLLAPPYGVYSTNDRYIVIAMGDLSSVEKALKIQAGLLSNKDPMIFRDEIYRIIQSSIANRSADEVLNDLREHGLWVGPVETYEDLKVNPQVEECELLINLEHPEAGQLKLPGLPIRFNGQNPQPYRPPSKLGEHTIEILREAGFTSEDITRLRNEGVLVPD